MVCYHRHLEFPEWPLWYLINPSSKNTKIVLNNIPTHKTPTPLHQSRQTKQHFAQTPSPIKPPHP
jgi:hypothetical protein